jgi:hypothetical protein
MKSPFPGMDPYLERHWGDVRASLVVYGADQMQPTLAVDLVARINTREYLEREPTHTSSRFQDEPITESFIEILDIAAQYRVVTTIEFLSSSTKRPGSGNRLYRKKQRELEADRASLVEIDLVLGGRRATIRRGWNWHQSEVVPIPLHTPLPAIPIPLRQSEQDAKLMLQPLLEKAYRMGRYDDIDYQEDADPPLEGRDAEWADALLRQAGKRK